MSPRAALLLLIVACGNTAPAQERYDIQLQAQLPDGAPQAGVRFWLMGHELGPTGRDGRAAITLAGHEGDSVQVTTLCPAGLRGPSEPRALRLQRVAAIDDQQAPPLSLTLRCEPEQARAALVVRALRANAGVSLPISIDGRVVGQTDADGVAHVLLHGAPRSSLQVRLDTSAMPTLVPHTPVRVFELEETESVLLFDQAFEVARATQARRRVVRPTRARVPYRIE